jgi:hypothetical protein
VLIGAAGFGTLTIARPLQRMAGVLGELTNDRIVEVPYTTRGDEIGDIAKATDVFKQSIAEKVINLRVRAGLDVVRSGVNRRIECQCCPHARTGSPYASSTCDRTQGRTGLEGILAALRAVNPASPAAA